MTGCEVCETLGRGRTKGKRVLVGERLVTLCPTHERAVSSQPVAGMDELRALFRENTGRRSLVERRMELDRRVFPVRPEGRRRSSGRRNRDAAR
jgi:hypothetical protein